MNITEKDKKYIWHPLTQHKLNPETLPIKKAKGALLWDEDGKEYVDGISSWYTAVYGHCNDFIIMRAQAQMENLDQVVFSGFTHQPAVDLAEKLISILPEGQQKVFYNDNGSTATEIGIKMALQYHFNQGKPRKRMLAFEDGFHGDTLGAMSASGLSVYNGPFEDFFIDFKRIPLPDAENLDAIKSKIKQFHEEENIAGFIYEPLVQGAAGMHMYSAEALNEVLEFCRSLGIILVADEVMTGFGKTGKNFASDYVDTKPDVICLSKALSAGLVPMGATTCTQAVYDAFYSDDIGKGLFHGHTYSGNPIACATALAGLDLLTSAAMQENIANVVSWHKAFAKEMQAEARVENVRQLGTIIALELKLPMERYGNLRYQIFNFCLENGAFLRPLGATMYIAAPYVTKREEMERLYETLRRVIEKFC